MRDWIVYLEDITVSCDKIVLYTQNLTFEIFALD